MKPLEQPSFFLLGFLWTWFRIRIILSRDGSRFFFSITGNGSSSVDEKSSSIAAIFFNRFLCLLLLYYSWLSIWGWLIEVKPDGPGRLGSGSTVVTLVVDTLLLDWPKEEPGRSGRRWLGDLLDWLRRVSFRKFSFWSRGYQLPLQFLNFLFNIEIFFHNVPIALEYLYRACHLQFPDIYIKCIDLFWIAMNNFKCHTKNYKCIQVNYQQVDPNGF